MFFSGTAQFDRNDVLSGVNAKRETPQQALQLCRTIKIITPNHGGGGKVLRDFLQRDWARQDRDQMFRENFS